MLSQVTTALILAATAIRTATAVNFDWDCTRSLGTCNNACYAIYHNLAPSQLNYDSNSAHAGPRRTASGCSRNPCNNNNLPYHRTGNSCDEFPFASTTQGGAGAILRCVDGPENSSEGGQLSAFYRSINNGARFGVVVRNYRGARFCDNHAAANDGSEFRLRNGAFVNAKFRLRSADPGFEDAAPGGTPAVGSFREYEDEEGGRVLHLSIDAEGTLVGDTVSDGTRTLKIVKEVTGQ